MNNIYSRFASRMGLLACLACISPGGHSATPLPGSPANDPSDRFTAGKERLATMAKPAAFSSGQAVVSLSLINADTEQEIRAIAAGEVLNLAGLPTRNLNIRANTNPATVGSVVFSLSGSGSRTQTETSPPYALFGDMSGNYNPWTPAVGSYTLTATPFTAAGGTGTAGTPLSLSFSVTDQPSTTNLPPVAHAGADQTITLPTSSAVLNGTASSDPDGSIVSYAWTQVSGPGPASISGAGNCPAAYEEQNGLVVVEAENLALPAGWQKKTAVGGYTGSGYIEWVNPASFFTPGTGLIETTVRINKTGKYYFRWHNKVGKGTSTTDYNDSWLRLPDASNFYAEGARTVYPHGSGKTPTPNGVGSEGWFKVYASGTLNWTWSTNTSDRELLQVVAEFNTPGVYKVQISARSDGHLIDRFALYHSSVAAATALSLANPETRCSGTTAGGGTGATPTVSGLVAGLYTFSLAVTDDKGAVSSPDQVTVAVNPDPAGQQQVVSFSLINADTEQEIKTIAPGEQFNLAGLPTRNLNIRVNTQPAIVGSVVMSLSGSQSRSQTETSPPYALFGDVSGNYLTWTPAVGSYSLTTTPFTAAGGTGTAGTSLTVGFSVVDQSPAARTASRTERDALRLYPNPVLYEASVEFTLAESGDVALHLFSVQGAPLKQVYAGWVEARQKHRVLLKSEGLPEGVYILKLTSGRKALFTKLFVSR